jgi:hypothetical protein
MNEPRKGLAAEWFMAGLVVLVALRGVVYFAINGYLPEPFFYESSDTWMDWFNTAWWAHNKGIYDSWASIYPPISFVILRVLGISHCYASPAAGPSRGCATGWAWGRSMPSMCSTLCWSRSASSASTGAPPCRAVWRSRWACRCSMGWTGAI